MSTRSTRGLARDPDRSSRGGSTHRTSIAGASAVGVGTALFYDPLVCSKINDGIAAYLEANDMSSVADLTGTLQT